MSENVAAARLRSFIERIERLEEEKKGTGFDAKVLRRVIAIRKMDPEDRQNEEVLLETYLRALGEASTNEGDDDDE